MLHWKHSQQLVKELLFNDELPGETGSFRIYSHHVEPCLQPRIDLYSVTTLSVLFVKHSTQVIINAYHRIFGNCRKKDRESSAIGRIRIQANNFLINNVDWRFYSGARARNERRQIVTWD